MPYKSIFSRDLFEGSVCLVTGGGTGIGRAVVHELACAGASTIIIAARRRAQLERTAAEVKAFGSKSVNIECVELDIKDNDRVCAVIRDLVQRHGKITHLVNNAGGQFLSPADSISPRGFRTVVELNLMGTWNVTRAVFDQSMRDHGGSIVNVLIANKNGFPGMAHSGAARSGVENLSKTLAVEWGRYGVRVNCVSPGTVIGSGLTSYPPGVLPVVLKTLPRRTALNRLGTESEIATSIVYLLSSGASYTTGVNLCVDGGITLSPPSSLDGDAGKYHESKAPIHLGYSSADEALGSGAPEELKQSLLRHSSKL